MRVLVGLSPVVLLGSFTLVTVADADGTSAIRSMSPAEQSAPAVPTGSIDGEQPAGADALGGRKTGQAAATDPLVSPPPRWKDDTAEIAEAPLPQPKPGEAESARGLLTQGAAPVPEPAAEPRQQAALEADTLTHVIIHHPGGATEAAADDLRGMVEEQGHSQAEVRTTESEVSQADVRYFHAEDRAVAESVNKLVKRAGYGSELKDLTGYDPLPARGTVEVWLPE